MGNCCRHESSTEWDREEWGSPLPQKLAMSNGFYHKGKRESAAPKKESLLGNDQKHATEVKIKVTRKELEELLGKVNLQGMSVEQVLEQLVHFSDEHNHDGHHKHWKPALQSIPEDN